MAAEQRLEDRAQICQQLVRLISQTPATIYYGLANQAPLSRAMVAPTLRVNLLLSGSKRVALPLADGPSEVTLHAGDGHVSLPHSWERHSWDSPHEMICLVPREQYLRVSYYLVTPGRGPRNWFYHTDRPCEEALRLALRALAACRAQAPIRHLIMAIAGLALNACQRPPATQPSQAQFLFERLQRWVDNSFQEPIDRAAAAQAFQLSPGYVSRLFAQVGGMRFIDYLTGARLDYARQLLETTDLPIHEVGRQCGFGNNVHFVRCFRQQCGFSPGRYRQRMHAALA